MTKMIELVLGLTDKLLITLLDWPFLLFVLVAWILIRYRDQIGSMLDRRGAVGAGVVIKAVRREMQPVLTQVEGLAQAVSELKYEVERLQALHSENRLSRVLEPVKLRIKGLEEAIARTQTETDKILRQDVPEALSQERTVIKAEIDDVRKALDQYGARIKTLAAQDLVDRTGAELKSAQSELDTVTKALGELQSYAQTLAGKEATEGLKKEIASLAGISEDLKASLAKVEATAAALPGQMEEKLQGELATLRGELSQAQGTIATLVAGLERAATKDVTDRLQTEVEPMLAELNALRESISRFETSISATAQQLGERMTSEVTPLSQDVSSVKAAVDSLSSQVAAAASTETTNRLEKALAPLAAGLDELKASLATLEGKVATGPKELEDRVAEDVSRIGKEIAALKDALEQATSQPSAPKPAQAAGPVRGPKTDAVSVMKKALNNSGKAGRRVDALAKIAGVSEAQALEILAASGDFTVGTNSKGQHTARLAGK